MIWRYENEEIRDLWTPTAVYDRWFDVEVAVLREHDPALAELAIEIGGPPQRLIAHHEKLCGHDVMAFLRAWDETIQKSPVGEVSGLTAKLRAQMHYGLTSSDVVDTALARAVLDSGMIVDKLARDLSEDVYNQVVQTNGKRTIGRTHGQLAAAMPAPHRWIVLFGILHRVIGRAFVARSQVRVGKLSGPMGTLFQDSESGVLNALGLEPIASTQLVPRDGLAHYVHALAELATVAEAIVTQVWLLAQSGVDEVRLRRGMATSSSAMPHKDNPVACETVRGLARMARAQAEVLQLGVIQWGEHDMAHSSVERVALPDLFHLLCTILTKTSRIVSSMDWTEPSLPDHYRDTSAVLRSAQSAGLAWADAHAAIRQGRLTVPYQDGKIADTTAISEETK